MDRFMTILLNKDKTSARLEYFKEEHHMLGILFKEEDGEVVEDESPKIKYEVVKDLRSILIPSLILSNNGIDVGEIMGFTAPVNEGVVRALAKVVTSDEVLEGRAAGFGDIALANALCREENKELMRFALCEGYGISDCIIREPNRFDSGFVVDEDYLDEENDMLFVKNLHIYNLKPYTNLRSVPQTVLPYEQDVRGLIDADLYLPVSVTCLATSCSGVSYMGYRQKLVGYLEGIGIEVLDSLYNRPRVKTLCPATISYDQLDSVVLYSLINNLVNLY